VFAAALLAIFVFTAAPFLVGFVAVSCLFGENLPLALRVGGFIVLMAVAVVYLKSLLPRRIPLPPAHLTVTLDDQPTASAFMARVAEDIGVPGSVRLALGSGAELALGGRRSVLDFVRAGSWEVRIGLGLWHGVTLSELQALAARTLAPLGARGLPRARRVARELLAALVDGNDRLDDAADGGIPLAGALRACHRVLTFPWRGLGSLILQLDPVGGDAFADDLAAVRVAGSDALVHAVLRADLAAAALREVDDALALAARDRVFSADLYAHYADGVTLVREAHNDFTLGEPPVLRGPSAGKHADVFDPGRRYLSAIWHEMPLGDAREQNAKRIFVPAERDDRPAAELLHDPTRLRERMTRLHYLEKLGAPPDYLPMPADTVRAWLRCPGGPTFPTRYGGAYDGGRRLNLGTPGERETLLTEPWDDRRLLETASSLYAHAADRATTWRKARLNLDRLLVRTGYQPAGRHAAVAEDLEEDLHKSGRWLTALDRWVYVVQVQMAARLADLSVHDELIRRYDSVLRFQPLAADAREYRNRVAAFVRRMAAYPGAPPLRVERDAAREFKESANDLAALLAEARSIDDPFLKAWTGEVRLDEFLYSRSHTPARSGQDVEAYGRRLLTAWEEVTAKGKWLHRHALADLLGLQERILAEFSFLVTGKAAGPAAGGSPSDADLPEVVPDPIDLDPLEPE
jgi:hypothetical protein